MEGRDVFSVLFYTKKSMKLFTLKFDFSRFKLHIPFQFTQTVQL